MKRAIKQVHYISWGTGTKKYWNDVGAIAEFIGAALNYPMPRCNGYGVASMASTIRVDQFKEKFGDVRVYCQLAAPELVKEAYDSLKERSKMWKHPCTQTLEKYTRERFVCDAKHYRSVYLNMVELVPKYRKMIVGAADYYELLQYDAESLDAFIDRKDNIKFLEERYKRAGREAVRAELYELCGFKPGTGTQSGVE
jgi:hypothetical protein